MSHGWKCGAQELKAHVTVVTNVVMIRLAMSEKPHFFLGIFGFDSQQQKLSKSLVTVNDWTSKRNTAEGLHALFTFLSSVALLACTKPQRYIWADLRKMWVVSYWPKKKSGALSWVLLFLPSLFPLICSLCLISFCSECRLDTGL